MNTTMVGAGIVLVGAAGLAAHFQHQANRALRHDVAALREEVRGALAQARADQVRAERARVEKPGADGPVATVVREGETHDLATLREEIAALRRSTTVLTQLAQAAQAAKSLEKSSEAVPTRLVPVGALKNAGKATPEASTETTLWAAVGGDVDTLAGTLAFTPSARAKADEWFAGLTDATRQKYGSPEKVIALMIAKDAETVTGMQVLGRQEISPDNVGVRLRVAGSDGRTKDDTFLMHRSADGWKLVLPDKAVEKFARQLGGGR